jgi:hypothetical protein
VPFGGRERAGRASPDTGWPEQLTIQFEAFVGAWSRVDRADLYPEKLAHLPGAAFHTGIGERKAAD